MDLADEHLNQTYQALMKRLSVADQKALRAAQRAWIDFRDRDCAFGWAEQLDCLIARTDEREQQLRESIYFDRGGRVITLPKPD